LVTQSSRLKTVKWLNRVEREECFSIRICRYSNIKKVATVFLAQAFALLVYFVYKHVDKKLFLEKEERAIKEGKSVKFNKFLLAIPAFCGSVVSTLQLVSLNFINSSVY